MPDYSAKVANMENSRRFVAIMYIILGSILICFSIADRAVDYYWTGYGCCGIWIGVWMCFAGGLYIPGKRRERNTSRNAYASVYRSFAITSAVFGGTTIIVYSIGIATYGDGYYDGYDAGPTARYDSTGYRNRQILRFTQVFLIRYVLIIGIVEFTSAICAAAVCHCLIKPGTFCYGISPQQDPMKV